MRKLMIVSVFGMAMLVTACGNNRKETQVTPTVEKTTAAEIPTENKETDALQTEETLTDYLTDYRDSTTYHLLNDIALNEEAVTKEDNVTYTFETGKDGKRTLGYVSAHFEKVLGDTTYPMSFCRSFIQMELPELSEAYKSVVIGQGEGEYLQEMTFQDYKISLIPNEELTEMTVIIEPVINN